MATLLVVDDSLTDRRLITGLLSRSLDCRIAEAPSGDKALEAMDSVQPDVVLTDLQMPGMNGLELVTRLRDEYPDVPVILMTAQGSESIAAEALHSGAASYVAKQRLADDLVPTVQRILSAVQQERTHSRLMHHLHASDLHFVLHNDAALIQPLVRMIQEMLRSLPLEDEAERLRVGVAVEEALKNAIFCGNLEVGEAAAAGRSRDDLVAERTWLTPYGTRNVDLKFRISRDEAVFTICDEGPGFDVARYESADFNGEDERSRSIRLMRTFMDDVRFEDGGRCVVLRKATYQCDDEE